MSPEKESQEEQRETEGGSETPGEKSEVEILREEIAKLKEDNKKIREEKLEAKTSPAYFESLREQKRKEREARILNTRLPREYQVTEAQLQEMTTKELAAFLNDREQRLYESITRDKIIPMVEQEREDTAELGLRELSKIEPDWQMYLKDMISISKADTSITAEDCFIAACAKNKDWRRLERFRKKLEGTAPKKEAEMAEEKEVAKKEVTKPKDYGQRPAVSISGVKKPSQGMTVHEAAKRAYEEVFEQGKGG